MTATNIRVQMQQRRDTAANWTSADPTLLASEFGYETDTGKLKIGDGSTAWSSLAYEPGFSLSAYPLATADIADDAITGAKLANDITIANDLTVTNNLTVNGTTTTIDTTTLVVEDKNIEMGAVTTPSDVTADGGGITLKGATDKTINWIDSTDAWTFSEHVNIASAKEYRINGTKVLDATSLGSAVVSSSLTSVGTIATGVWNGTPIATAYIADGAAYQVLQTDSGGSGVEWTNSLALPGTLAVTGQTTLAEIKETVSALSGTAIDPANGSIQTKTIGANTTFTESFQTGQAVVLHLLAGASYTVTWPTITWVTGSGNTAPTLTANDVLVLWKVSTTLYGAYVGSAA